MKEVLLLKLGEVVLKGLNRRKFEDKLLNNLRRRLAQIGPCEISCMQSTIFVEPGESVDIEKIVDASSRVFGIVNICRCCVCEKDMNSILNAAKTYFAASLQSAKSFKVESKRADKRFPLSSIKISQALGGDLDDAFPSLKPDMHNPELLINVEIREKAAYLHAGNLPGAGGIPVGTSGTAALLLSGGIDSPVAGHMMARRGLELIGVHFFSYPYTSERAKEKVLELARLLTRYAGRIAVFIVPFTEIQEAIRDNCPEEYFTLIMRRFMMRIAERIAREQGAGALITGESLGQVASQTMQAMASTGEVCQLPVFRPLIGMDKEEIVKRAREIGTFDTSILPYEDCCTVFTPKHPQTRPKLERVRQLEAALDVEKLTEISIKNVEKIVL